MNTSFIEYRENMNYFMALADEKEDFLTAPLSEGKWSKKEIIGHIYFWDVYLLEKMVPDMADGAILAEFPDHDEYNAEAVNYINKFSATADLLNEFSETRKKLLFKLEQLDPQLRFTIGKGKRKFTSESFLGMFVKHDQHHMKQIQGASKRQSMQ
jgi:uncharacterized damage-inducible protein DinB